ncbi:MAG: hypothetical protein KAQ68_00750 [Clostridiales bacterium]|nr:hypothetical protein [Clostridiales bacterium]
MIDKFIDFVEQLFPIHDPQLVDEAKEAYKQFNKEGHQLNFYGTKNQYSPVQGDIISRLPFVSYDDDGNELRNIHPAMILANSCEIDNKENIIVAPLLEISNFNPSFLGNIKNNKNYNLLYLPGADMDSKVVDFSLSNTFNAKNISTLLESGKIEVTKTLNQLGYYFFLCKLTMFLARREDPGIQSIRKIG